MGFQSHQFALFDFLLPYFLFFFFFKLINLFIFGCVGSSFLCKGFLQFSSCGKRGPLFITVRGPLTVVASRCGARAPDAQAQQLWLTGLVAPRHVGSSQTRAQTRVPCIGRQILNHCATREAPYFLFIKLQLFSCWSSNFLISRSILDLHPQWGLISSSPEILCSFFSEILSSRTKSLDFFWDAEGNLSI